MKIFVEGIDGSGKTTLINKIKKMFPYENFKVIHCTKDTPNNYNYFAKLLRSDDNIIFDRFCWGQKVYQTSEERIALGWCTDSEIKLLENWISSHGNMICIFVDTPLQTCYENCLKDNDDSHYTLEYIELLKSRYDDVMLSSSVHWMVLDNNFNIIPNTNPKNFNYSSLPTIYAVDFDGTLVSDAFPNINDRTVINHKLVDSLITAKDKGIKLILWTNRTDEALNDAIKLCASVGLEFDAINDNIEEVKLSGLNPRKVYADIYIDDKAVQIKRVGDNNEI